MDARAVSRWLAGAAALGLLAACSGSSGGGGVASSPAPSPAPAPTPTPAPVPTPTPTPPPSSFDTPEYRATVGAVSMNALAAYAGGGTGAGVSVGVIDSGIDLDSAEFGNRVSTVSTNTANPGSSIDDQGGHGTAVAFTIAGRRNGTGTHGVAFDATLIVLRADTAGSCAGGSDGNDDGCSYSTNAIADALDVATNNGARVVNISLGGGGPPGNRLTNAINRATAAGVVIVISAGNDGNAEPDVFASQPATNASVSRGLVIIAGSVGSNDQISSFSNRAGASGSVYLAAVGESVRAPDQNGTVFLWSGTSFSAPQISGAVALLAQAFPNLTGSQIVNLLYTSARDAGAPGIDPVFGRGVLDLTRAFQPQGSSRIAGSQSGTVRLEAGNAMLSAPMGDAATGRVGAVILDGFDRAYAVELAQSIQRQVPGRRLAGVLSQRERSYAAGIRDLTVAVTIVPGRTGARIERAMLPQQDAERARAIAASVSARLGANAQFGFGIAESGQALAARLAGQTGPAFLVAREPTTDSGFDSSITGAVALRRTFGRWGLALAAETGDALLPYRGDLIALRGRRDRLPYTRVTLGADRTFGPLEARVAASWLDEGASLLGARFAPGFGAARGSTFFFDIAGRAELGGGWSLGAAWRQGFTRARLTGVAGSGQLVTTGFAADLGKAGVLAAGDWLGFRIAQPLRVARGGLDLVLPADYDYATTSVTAWDRQRINLAPTGREIDFELGYSRPLWGGAMSSNLFLRRDPGHFAALDDDIGVAVRFTLGL